MTESENTSTRRHHLGGAFRNPEPPVKVEAAGRRGRAEGPRGPAPRDPCRVERPALTGGGGVPTLACWWWRRVPWRGRAVPAADGGGAACPRRRSYLASVRLRPGNLLLPEFKPAIEAQLELLSLGQE